MKIKGFLIADARVKEHFHHFLQVEHTSTSEKAIFDCALYELQCFNQRNQEPGGGSVTTTVTKFKSVLVTILFEGIV